MGCDGGSIPRRDELVKMKKKAEKVDPQEVERIKWFTCAMSNEKLKEPIVACELGHLYNKEAVIRALLEKNVEEKFSHIRSLKDLITPRFTPNPSYSSSAAETDDYSKKSPFLCPITQEEVGRVSFSLLRTCGCVISERALREVPSPTCVQCGVAFKQEDVIVLNPSEEEKQSLRVRMEARREGEKGKKKERREKKKKENGESSKVNEKGEKENGMKEKIGNGKAAVSTDKDTLIGKKREVESSSSTQPPTKTSRLTSSSSSKTSTSTTTTTTTTTTTATYTPYVAPHSGEKGDDDLKAPSTLSVPKTAAYNSMFKSNSKAQTSNNLFSGIY